MKRTQLLLVFLVVLSCPVYCLAQAWSGILSPTYGTGACTLVPSGVPAQCAIDWTQSGIPGGIPSGSWTQSGSTILASTYGNGSTDATSGIQSALNSCGGTSSAGKFVLLGAGTFLIDGNLSVPSYCVLRGSGAQSTILNRKATTGATVNMGSGTPSASNSVTVTSGANAGSTSIVVSSASGISAGSLLMITELNDALYVSPEGNEGNCTWCDASMWSGTRVRGQIVMVQSVSGTTITITPLYSSFGVDSGTTPVYATYFTPSVTYAGVENLQIYANGTSNSGNTDSSAEDTTMAQCAYCWVKGIEDNYTDGDHVHVFASYRCEVRDSYFHSAYLHVSGQCDDTVDLAIKTSGTKVENNIFDRNHTSIMLEWGAAGNVIAYNYGTGNFDTGSPNVAMMDYDGNHGSHPQFNLVEGNVVARLEDDGIWGSSSHNTWFRNWPWGTTFVCNPESAGRNNVSCSSGTWMTQAIRAAEAPQQTNDSGTGTWYDNWIGNVMGSTALANLGTEFKGGPSPCLACDVSPTSRGYDTPYDYTFGYGGAGDSTGACSSVSTCTAYLTTFLHGNYDHATGSVEVWASGVTQTLPASFIYSSQPSWWTSGVSWPGIGPDVTGGTGPGGHASLTASNPAQACYNSSSTLSDGSLAFNASTCYPGAAPPAPPTAVAAVAH